MITNVIEDVNEKVNSVDNHVTEIKRENSPFCSKFIDIEHNHVQFENVLIKTEQEDHFFKENVEENFGLINQEEIRKVSQNDINLKANAIKKENENQDFEEHLQETFNNNLETCDSENDYRETKEKENYDYPLHSEKCTDAPSTNLDEIKIDIVDNYIESVNNEINIKYKNENIEKFSTEVQVIPLKDQVKDKTDKEMKFFHKILEVKQEKISLDKNIKQKKCNVDNRKAKMVKNHECSICKSNFSQSSSLNRHMKIHTGEKSHECDVCQKKFTQSSSLICHKRIHTGEKPHACNVCQKKFNDSTNLMRHMRIHTGEKPHECDVCQKKFTYLTNLMLHMRIHTGEKPHACDVCQKKFTHSTNLMLHMRIHTGEKPHECDVCQKKFTQLSSLMCHKRIHTGEKPPVHLL